MAKHLKNGKQSGGILAAGIAGIIAGAGAALAATMVLKNKKNQKKIKDAISGAKEYAVASIKKLKK